MCFRERRNRFSEKAIVVQKALGYSECNKKKMKKAEEVIVGHIPESLSEFFFYYLRIFSWLDN